MEVVLTLPLGQPHISHVKAGETITNTYNDWNLPVMQTVTGTNSDTSETRTDTRSFTYDNLGRKISATNESGTATYEYDDFGRLTKETDITGAVKEYTYDAYGNRTRSDFSSATGENHQTFYQYNANNQLVQEQRYEGTSIENGMPYTYSYTYDENGNQRYRTVQAASNYKEWGNEGIGLSLLGEAIGQYDNAAVEMYSYNGFGQMTQAVVDGTTAAYAYNPDGLRISKTVNGETTKHILDGSNVVADIKGGAISKYNRGRGLISIEQGGNKGYYTFNGHGDVIGIVDGNGSLTNKTQFYAYGGEIYQESTAFNNPFGYAGEYTDVESGNIYLRARYYDPNTGRFVSEDPIKDGANWYAYCGNNPVMMVDPWGLANYIYYTDSDQKKAANATKEQLIDSGVDEEEIFLISITNAEQFVTYWNEEMGKNDTIDSVFIHMHGETDYIQGGNNTKIYVSDLESKTIDTIFLTACSTGNMNYIGDNVASQLAMTQNVKRVIAPDGLGYFMTPNDVSSNYFPDDGIVREGNGFVLYQNSGGNLLVVPGLTENLRPVRTLDILERGKMIESFRNTFIWNLIRNNYSSINTTNIVRARVNHPDSIYEMLKELGIVK